jgi:hypothetical protein
MLISSIIRRHNHTNALAFIGLSVENSSFPTVLGCPFCGETTLYAFDNTVREDIWLNCNTCSAHGNIITFAAQIWKVDITAAIDRLVDSGLVAGRANSEDVSDILRLNDRQRAAHEFWTEAAESLWVNANDIILQKYREYGISREIPCLGLIGTVPGTRGVEFCASIGRSFPRHMRPRHPIIVFPYYDLPNHHTGFLFMQHGTETETKTAYVPNMATRLRRVDSGYFLLQNALLPTGSPLNEALFISDDPCWALKTHITQLRHDTARLPVCASYIGHEAISHATTLHNFPQTKKMFAGSSVTPELISQAANSRGYVCVTDVVSEPQPTMPVQTMRQLSRIYKSASTWQTTLENHVNSLNQTEAVAFASKLHVPREKLQQFLKDKTALPELAVIKIIEQVQPHHGIAPNKNVNFEVIERDGGWFTASGLCVTNCVPVITRVIYTEKGDKYYEGYVKKTDQIVEFFSPASRIERVGLLTYAGQLFAARGELVITAPRWDTRATEIALRLHPPPVVTVSNTPGWDDKTREFHFAAYSLTNDGAITPAVCSQLQTNRQFDFPEPSIAAPLSIHNLLTPSHENAFVWAVTAAVLTDMIAPILNIPPTSVAIRSDAYTSAINCGKALNCTISEIGAIYQASRTSIGTAIKSAAGPSLIYSPHETDTYISSSIIRYPNRPVLLKVTAAGLPAALTYGWTGIAPLACPSFTADLTPLRFIVPAYIQRVLRQRMGFGAIGAKLLPAVLRDAHKWLDETYGTTFNLSAAEQIIMQPDTAHEALMLELNKAICTGKIDILPRPRFKTQSQNYVVRGKDHWWLSRKAIDTYLIKTGIVPNWIALLHCFTKQGVFCGEEIVHKSPGFLIKREWCDMFWSDYKTTEEKNAG